MTNMPFDLLPHRATPWVARAALRFVWGRPAVFFELRGAHFERKVCATCSTIGANIDAVVPELDFTYMFSDHVGAELILATSPHDLDGRSALAPVGKLADTMALPPTLTLQYHFMPEASVRPYVGAGINYTIFYNEDASRALETAIGATRVSAEDSFGYAVQAGFDVDLSEKVFLNVDVKYIDIDTTATLRTGALVNRTDVSLDPLVFGVGLGMRF